MDEASPVGKSSPARSSPVSVDRKTNTWTITFLLAALAPVLAAAILYQLESFDPAPFPTNELPQGPMFVPRSNPHILSASDKVGSGRLSAPEDVAYDPKTQVIYTGCADGWVKRVTVNESAEDTVVENWVNTGGRPLGIAVGHDGEVIIADAQKGLLAVHEDGIPQLLTDEAEGLKFGLTDAVDVAKDGTIYFTDASYKYNLKENVWDILEGRPHGRLLSYDPSAKQTKVLLRDLYFANGVAVSPDQNFVVFCETPMKRCTKYYVRGKKNGLVEVFVDNLPGMPDNIRYDGEGQYWIAIAAGATYVTDIVMKYPSIRKVMVIMDKYTGRPHVEKNGGVLAVDLAGKPASHYYDPGLSMISSGIKIGNHLYCGSLIYPHIIRLNVAKHPATVKKYLSGSLEINK